MLFFSLSIVSSAAMFMAVGGLTSQLLPSRRHAAALGGGVIGVSFAIRMVADSSASLVWLHWGSPLGWVEELHPLTGSQPLVLLLIAGFTLIASALNVYLAGTRDLATSVIPARSTSRPHTALLSGPAGLAVRLLRGATLAWIGGVMVMALLLGSETKVAVKALQDSSSVRKVLVRLGGQAMEAKTYLGLSFLIVALIIALAAIGQVVAARKEEASGRLDHLLVAPLSRSVWLGGRIVLACAVVMVAGGLAGLVAWIGTGRGHEGVGLFAMLGAGLNTVPPAVCLIGIGAAAFGFVPRKTSLVMYGVLTWSFLIELVGGVGISSHWLLDTSVFHHMRPSPAFAPDWTSAAIMVAVGVAAGVLGVAAFTRRDMTGD